MQKKKCFNSDLEEIKKGNPEKNSDHKKMHCTILICFTN